MTLPYDILTNIAANLASEVLERGAGRVKAALVGDAQQQALRRAWEAAFRVLLESITDVGDADLLEHIFRDYVQAEGVAPALLDLALADGEPPLELLRARFDALDYDRATLPLSFDTALITLTRGLSAALLTEAQTPDSPLYNRVSVMRIAAIHTLLQQQRGTLDQIAASVARLEAQLPAAKYNLVFLGPASGFAIGDGAQAVRQADAAPPVLSPDLTPLLEQTLGLLTDLVRERQPSPYTPADLEAYLQAVVAECRDIRLPYATDKGATLPLERIYVALKADRSAPAERRASRQLMEQLVEEQRAGGALPEAAALARVAILNPYAARYLIYDPEVQAELRQAAREAQERTYHLAELVRRHRWLVLLGDPGSGKSTLARWLALHLARAQQAGAPTVRVPGAHVRPDAEPDAEETLGATRLPVLVRIADYAAARWPQPGQDSRLSLLDYLGRHFGSAIERSSAFRALVRDYLTAGRATFILDGLDEVTDYGQRQAIAAEIESLIRAHGCDAAGRCPLDAGYHATLMAEAEGWEGNQVLVTSRIVGYQFCPLHEALPHFVIQPMENAAVRRFCENWAACYAAPEQATALTKAVLKHPNPNVREQMGRNPLLLTILAQVFQEAPTAGLPARRTELYSKAAQAVFRQRQPAWENLRARLGGADLASVLNRVTAHVAFNLHANPEFPAALVDTASVRQWLRMAVRAEPALSGGRREDDVVNDLLAAASRLSGFFVARGEGAYGFLHRQFQEYFAALQLAAQVREGSQLSPYLNRLDDPAWREVLLLAAGILEGEDQKLAERVLSSVLDAPDPTRGLLPHNLLLASDALQELAHPTAALVQRIAEGLIAAYRREDAARFAVLQPRVRHAFEALPRQVRGRDPVGAALCAALLAPGDADTGRFTRMAAAELVADYQWFTPVVARALAQSWQTHLEPAGTILGALQAHYAVQPEHFAVLELPFRQAVNREPALWAAVQAHTHWQSVVQALYLAPHSALAPEAIVRDSPLTPALLTRLREDPANDAGLRAYLWEQWEQAEETPAGRDSGQALIFLGECRLAAQIVESSTERPLARALCAATYLGRALALDLVLTLALALDLDHALDHVLDHARALKLARASTFKLAPVRASDLDLDHACASTFKLARVRVRALDRDRASGRVRARTLDLDLDRTLDLDRDRDLDRALTLARASASARDLDLTLARASASARDLDLTLDRWRDKIAEIDGIVTPLSWGQTFPITTDLVDVDILEYVQRRLADWRALWPTSGVLEFWKALAEAWQKVQEPLRGWTAAERQNLNPERLTGLLSAYQREEALPWAILLPRLDGTPLVRLDSKAEIAVRSQLENWLQAATSDSLSPANGQNAHLRSPGNGIFPRHAALLLAEMGVITAQTVPLLCACLCDATDLTRYRAQQALDTERKASALGCEAIEQLVHCYRCPGQRDACTAAPCWRVAEPQPGANFTLADTYLDWTLKEIRHDRPEWLLAWAAAGEIGILDRIHRLDDFAWPAFLELLRSGTPAVQEDLLDSASWLARLDRISQEHVDAFTEVLLTLLESDASNIRAAATKALGHLCKPTPTVIERLLAQGPPAATDPAFCLVHYETLARLAAASGDETLRERLINALQAALPDTAAAAGWVRFQVIMIKHEFEPTAWLSTLAETVPDPAGLLTALLRAGTDDDVWSSYHERIASTAAALVQEDGSGALLPVLLEHLREALDNEGWPAKRIALAAVAGVARAMPDALNAALRERAAGAPEALLLKGTRNADSHNSRRHAIAALGHLHTATPAVLVAVLDAAGDIEKVQQGAVAAAAGFRHLSPDFTEDEALTPLVEALTGGSAARAYLAAQVLAALGSSPAVAQAPGLQARIAEQLSAAIGHPDAGREVYLLGQPLTSWRGDKFDSRGPLSQALFAALVKVWGLPE